MKNKINIPVAIIMGSSSDWKVMKEAAKTLKYYGIAFHVEVVSAHRSPLKMVSFSTSAKKNNFQVIIAGAGGAAHLPGMCASLTNLPVIGVPIMSKSLKGIDSLLSIAQMPKGIPVACMAIDNSTNAALFALRILALKNPILAKKLNKETKNLLKVVKKMNQEIKKTKRF